MLLTLKELDHEEIPMCGVLISVEELSLKEDLAVSDEMTLVGIKELDTIRNTDVWYTDLCGRAQSRGRSGRQ
jgi:hypothetical protein